MADTVNYPHCTECGRVFDSEAEANACEHNTDRPNIVPVMAARTRAESQENHQRLAKAQGRYVDQLQQNGQGRGAKQADDGGGMFDFRTWGGKRRF